ncbi:MAG: hypothetical protein RL701_2292 [Pseudomonadota bacterium]
MLGLPSVLVRRSLWAAVGSFGALTMAWVIWCLSADGDLLSLGTIGAVWLLVAAAIGAWLGFSSRAAWSRGLLVLLSIGAASFWVLAPRGWWASPPPTRSQVHVLPELRGCCVLREANLRRVQRAPETWLNNSARRSSSMYP